MNIPEFSKSEFEADQAPFVDFCDAFRRREDTITLIHQLNQMIKAVQRHRGISMGLLAGNQEFMPDFDLLQTQLERRLATLEAFAHCTKGLLAERDKENLHLAWQTICQNWQDDDLCDNFELHSHFVEQLLGMVHVLAKSLELPLSAQMADISEHGVVGDSDVYPKVFRKMELLNFVAKQMPEMIEQVAKVRGLATFAASAGKVDDTIARKLRYVLQCAQHLKERIRPQAERLDAVLEGQLPSLKEIKNYELKLMFLLNTVEKDVLSGLAIMVNSHQLFGLATEIIDVYWKVVNDGLSLLRQWHQDDLDVWVNVGS